MKAQYRAQYQVNQVYRQGNITIKSLRQLRRLEERLCREYGAHLNVQYNVNGEWISCWQAVSLIK